ncbi:membrane bound O-acyl transferase family-domain-containing protein [Halomicroarcula sp. F28]|uniref:wax synthase family protein n=1 Tax=Haloarcula salinisoli TaxID=2487746 RepID=UPI001C739C09|nr:membrane bound O-acyl transferase family-domain-containing protein [Halomicroarcula salinisoli]MBX0288274.1 membrane bound O-acyl transferase family-domain-containing protein [Halomicroarcula salinisoli]
MTNSNTRTGIDAGNTTARTAIGYGLPLACVAVLLAAAPVLSSWARLFGGTVVLLMTIKVGSWVLLGGSRALSLSRRETLLYWTVWPGVRPDKFLQPEEYSEPDSAMFVVGYAYLLAGGLLGLASLLAVPYIGLAGSTWLLVAGFLAAVHQGLGRILPFGLRWLGYPVEPLFNSPMQSQGVADFWSDRWNKPFIGMNRLFLTGPLASRVGIKVAAGLAFLVSGLIHELAISFPAGAGWGLPFLYFVVQAVLYTVEQEFFPAPADSNSMLRRAWTAIAVVGPVPLLFHGPFRMTFIAPLLETGRALLLAYPLEAYVSAGLWVGAVGHFMILGASFQVPEELDWETDLAQLKPLNRKVMWTYGGYIVMMIVSFGVMTALFHEQLAAGTPVALGLAGLIVLFWTVRVLVDFFYYDHEDWPDGVYYVVGHTMLTSLFLLLIAVYAAPLVVHMLGA